MDVRSVCVAALALGLTACGSGVEGTWIGKLDCDGVVFDWEMTLSKTERDLYEGDGEQRRTFQNVEGAEVDTRITFDIELEGDGGGEQVFDTTIACTAEDTVQTPANGGSPETAATGCTPRRYDGFSVYWDGGDTMIVSSDECDADLTKR